MHIKFQGSPAFCDVDIVRDGCSFFNFFCADFLKTH